ncbi:MAG: hypothetical protein AAGA77_21980 [Bacteroidota bacterium]
MRFFKLAIDLCIIFYSCNERTERTKSYDYLSLSNSKTPDSIPHIFRKDLTSDNQIIHRGVFSPDYQQFYFTVSNIDYSNFTIKSIHRINDEWSSPNIAFFNSDFDDHGMSFAPDGNSIYFSSTRKVNNDSIPDTWHLWKTTRINKKWTQPEFIDIPNLRTKLVSHPSITTRGRLYFHVSNLDYSDMHLLYSDQVNGKFQNAKPVFSKHFDPSNTHKCTPYISPNEDYIIYAQIEESLKLHICYKDKNQEWGEPIKLNPLINHNNQGNPFVTSDNRFLLFATGNHNENDWELKCVKMDNLGN